MNGAVLLTALATGLAGSAHCVAMCGGISASLGLGSTRKRYLLVYHGGRLLSYSTLGLIFGCLLPLFGFRPHNPAWGAAHKQPHHLAWRIEPARAARQDIA